MMAYIEVEDDSSSAEFIVFPTTLDKYTYILKEDAPLIIEGRLSLREERQPQVVCESFTPLSSINAAQSHSSQSRTGSGTENANFGESQSEDSTPAAAPPTEKTVWLSIDSVQSPVLRKVKPMLGMFPGSVRYKLYYRDTERKEECRAASDERLLKRLRELLGEESVVIKEQLSSSQST
jgi:DNA polymerase-3 subunit alpha